MQITLAPSGAFALTTAAGNTVHVPATPAGLYVIQRMLQAEARTPRPVIATDAAPIQHMIDEWLKNDAEQREAARRAKLESLGLTSITLTI